MKTITNLLFKEEMLLQAYNRNESNILSIRCYNKYIDDKRKMENLIPYLNKRELLLDALYDLRKSIKVKTSNNN